MDYNNRNSYDGYGEAFDYQTSLASCMSRVFIRMFAALVITALSAVVVVLSPSMQSMIFNSGYGFLGLALVEILLVVAISAGINKMSSSTAGILFFIYAIVNGLTLSVIFFAYNITTIYVAFGIAAAMFAATAAYGAVTKKSLAGIGSICMMALFGLIIATVVNIFLRSSMMDTIICYAGVAIFVGLTAFDTQRIKSMLTDAQGFYDGDEAIRKVSVVGALRLYLDFINMFLMILRILNKRS